MVGGGLTCDQFVGTVIPFLAAVVAPYRLCIAVLAITNAPAIQATVITHRFITISLYSKLSWVSAANMTYYTVRLRRAKVPNTSGTTSPKTTGSGTTNVPCTLKFPVPAPNAAESGDVASATGNPASA